MYYCLRCPPPSLIVLACHTFFIHEFSCPVFYICHFTCVKETRFFLCDAVRPTASQCVHTNVPPGTVVPLVVCVLLFFKAFICSDKRLISCCCLATVSTEIARQQQEIKCLSEQIDTLKKRGTHATRGATFSGGTTICTHCEAIGRTASHKKNSCYFDPRKITDRKDWSRKLMDEKGVACKDDE